MSSYGIGGNEVKGDASEAIADIPQNKTLVIEQLTADAPIKPGIVEGLQTVEDVFAHYKPEVEVEFQKEDGSNAKEALSFKNLGDFGVKGITSQSGFLKDLNTQREQYAKIGKQLKTNKLLRSTIENDDTKAALIDALRALIQELDDNK
ncbi:MAG: type VI secretion system contractile sheath small subunit [Chitinophagales bacterium]|nr:type VI secretion system contractile sheath small subunit [Chitinophagales bacterium]